MLHAVETSPLVARRLFPGWATVRDENSYGLCLVRFRSGSSLARISKIRTIAEGCIGLRLEQGNCALSRYKPIRASFACAHFEAFLLDSESSVIMERTPPEICSDPLAVVALAGADSRKTKSA